MFGNGVGAAGSGGAGGSGGSGGSSGVTGQNGASGTAGDAGGIESDNTLCVVGFNQCGTILQDTIVASDSGGNCAGLFSDGGNNLSFGDTTCFGINGDPKLGPLQDNGGPTETSDLGPGSAAINAGPASGPGCPATDQRGLPRPFGDACDIGAYEVTPPVATTGGATGVGSSTATLAGTVTANDVSASIRFDLGTTKTYGVQSTVQQVAGLTPAGVSTTFTGLTPSTTYHYRITATSSDGTTDGGDATFTTTAAHVGTTGPPIVGAITLRPSAFAAARSGASVTRAARTGTTVSYTDSETARTTLTILRARAGVLKGRKCTKPPPHPRSRRLRRCTRYVPVGSFIHADLAGTNRFHFTGRIGDHALVVGRYRLPPSHGRTGLGALPSTQPSGSSAERCRWSRRYLCIATNLHAAPCAPHFSEKLDVRCRTAERELNLQERATSTSAVAFGLALRNWRSASRLALILQAWPVALPRRDRVGDRRSPAVRC